MFKILIVEDDEITNYLSKISLVKFGFKNVSFALNGQEGLDYLKANEGPDLILLDINMPVMDGWEFLEALNSLSLCSNVPVVITTSSTRPQDRLKGTRFSNIIEYMEKPIDFKILNTIVLKMQIKNLKI
ncbi:response regulator [Maribacter arcticus]|uniref:response regulator n=1 Tax=Maribacter arcticus TaxID=561365 RepID=UPI0030027DCF